MNNNRHEELDEDGFQKITISKQRTPRAGNVRQETTWKKSSGSNYDSNPGNQEKKVFCRNFNTSEGCKFGDKCKFIHEKQKTQTDKPIKYNYKTKSSLCKNFVSGNCRFGDNCNFAHGEQELKKLYRENYENTSKSNIIFIRHGETPFNALLKNDKKEGLLKPKKEFLDCSISEDSAKKSADLKSQLDQMNFRYCFVSPLRRTLETALICLSNYKHKDKVKVIVLPVITEHISGSQHNICVDIDEKKKNFNKDSGVDFDWSLFEEETSMHKNQNLYFLEFIDNKSCVNDYEGLARALEDNYDLDSISSFLINYINANKHCESYSALNRRCKRFKAFLKDFISKNEIDTKKEQVLVFTHSAIIKLCSSKIASQSDTVEFFPNDSIYPSCLDFVRIDLD